MDRERHRRIKELFLRAEELDPAERDAYLVEACSSDEILRQEVERQLEVAQDTPESYLEPPRADDLDGSDGLSVAVGQTAFCPTVRSWRTAGLISRTVTSTMSSI